MVENQKAMPQPEMRRIRRIHFVGIGGVGMCGIAEVLLNLGYESFFRGTKTIRENRTKYNCNIPWLILFDPTSACNMHCVGCWSGTYGRKSSFHFSKQKLFYLHLINQ